MAVSPEPTLADRILAAARDLDSLAADEARLQRQSARGKSQPGSPARAALARDGVVESRRRELRRRFAELARLCREAERKIA